MTHVLRIAHLRIAHHVANPEVGKREVHQSPNDQQRQRDMGNFRHLDSFCIFCLLSFICAQLN